MVTIVKKSDVRLLTKTLAVVSLLAPASGYALGIGEIKLHSALNQNLDAEIALTLSGENVADIKVNLASPEKFAEAGVSWNYFLLKIKFETITGANNSAVIKLTSKEVLKEPFLDFLLEVSWPKGNLYREFTVLVDPPSVYSQATIPVSTSAESYAQPPGTTTARDGGSVAIGTTARMQEVEQRREQLPREPMRPPQRQTHINGQSGDGESLGHTQDRYGPTLGNDTLWSVAERARGQSDVSVVQMMMAIYKANPHAFYKENINALTAGKILNIPETEVVLNVPRNEAIAEFNRHTQAWKNHVVPAKEQPTLSKDEGATDNQLTLAAPTKAAGADHAVVASVNEQISTEKKTADVSAGVKGKAGNTASEAVPTTARDGGSVAIGTEPMRQNDAVRSKIADLEKQLAMMQELIALKDQQLAALQNQAPVTPVVQDQAMPSEVAAAKLADQTAPTPPIQQAAASQPVEPVAHPEADGLPELYSLGAGTGAIVLTLLGWLWWRKRKVDQETNTESMFASSNLINAPEAEEIISVPVVDDGAVHDAVTVGERSFLSGFTPSYFDSFDTDQGEIDPISEADVYLAYGRYQQAEELIRQAIKDQPNRDECKLKLLEVFYANENKTAFEAYANELAEAGKRNEAGFWEQAAEMGREICPDSRLFSSGNDVFAVADDVIDKNSNGNRGSLLINTPSVGRIGSLPIATLPPSLAVESVVGDNGFTKQNSNTSEAFFDVSAGAHDVSESVESKAGVLAKDEAKDNAFVDEQRNNQAIDFDLSSFSMDADEADKDFVVSNSLLDTALEAHIDNKNQEFESYEFDFSSDNIETKEIDGLDFGALEKTNKDRQYIDFSADKSLDFNDDLSGDFDFNFDLDVPAATRGQDAHQYDTFGVSDITDMDELETKLDLAKAYVDMGDAVAAQDLAKEVLEQGTVEQKKIAQALLDELD